MIKGKVLVVDDEEVIRETLKAFLEQNKYEVLTAADGEEGFKRAFYQNPDLILLDITMPGINGLELLSKLKDKMDRMVPVVMLTAKGDIRSMQDAEFMGSTDYIIKPFKLEEVLKLVKKYLDIYNEDPSCP
ncbi:MAG: response regulator [Candidatus Omnitrophota bacterium]